MLTIACSSPRRQDAYEFPNKDNKAPSPHQLQQVQSSSRQGQYRQEQYKQGQYRQGLSRQGQSRQVQSRQGQSRQDHSRLGQSHKTNGLAPLSFDLSFDLSFSLRIFVDWISFPVSYASVWGLGGREG